MVGHACLDMYTMHADVSVSLQWPSSGRVTFAGPEGGWNVGIEPVHSVHIQTRWNPEDYGGILNYYDERGKLSEKIIVSKNQNSHCSRLTKG